MEKNKRDLRETKARLKQKAMRLRSERQASPRKALFSAE